MAFIQCDFFSEVLGYNTTMNVILPGPFPTKNEKYPVLYLLHGMSDDHTAWQRRTSIERYAQEHNIAVVMPSVLLSFYTNMSKGLNYYDFISEEVPKVAKSLFPITNDVTKTYVAGLSMGGYGAFKIAFSNPNKYAAAGSFSGGLDMANIKKIDENYNLFENIFGNLDEIKNSNNDLLYLAENIDISKCPKLYQWCGTEDFLYNSNITFKNKAIECKLPLTYEEEAGDHQWKYWDICIQRFFEFIKE